MMDRDVLKELASLRNKKVFGPSDFYDMVDTVAFAGDTIDKLQTDVADFRHERNAAQQRAGQAERERDEARELLSRIRAITTASLSPLDWTPKTGAEIVGSLTDTPILPTDFDVNAAPTVKADDAVYSTTIGQQIERASDAWEKAGDLELSAKDRDYWMHFAVGDLLDIVERLVKGGAS